MINLLAKNLCFEGEQLRYSHQSAALNCEMTFSIYMPPQAKNYSVPVIYWLSGLTCTDENFVTKASAQQHAAQYGVAIVAPDTSPRGEQVPDAADEAYDLGLGAGFYVNATQSPWAEHYQMYSYIVDELPQLISQHFDVDVNNQSIMGHSMGGHGALTIALKHPEQFKSVSAFAPIVAPMQCAWGQNAFSHYLGNDETRWKAYDTTVLMEGAQVKLPMLIDQGTDDNFLATQLKTELLFKASQKVGYPVQIRMQHGYDHSYFFISTFIADHIKFHAEHLAIVHSE